MVVRLPGTHDDSICFGADLILSLQVKRADSFRDGRPDCAECARCRVQRAATNSRGDGRGRPALARASSTTVRRRISSGVRRRSGLNWRIPISCARTSAIRFTALANHLEVAAGLAAFVAQPTTWLDPASGQATAPCLRRQSARTAQGLHPFARIRRPDGSAGQSATQS